jgi:hypothetical protein
MLVTTLATYSQVSAEELKRLLALPAQAMYNDPAYQAMIAQIDSMRLQRSLGAARDIYEQKLPALKEKYGLSGTIMGGYTLCNWVLGYLMFPDRARSMIEHHARITVETVALMLPELIELLNPMGSEAQEWQRALIVFSLPLLAAR